MWCEGKGFQETELCLSLTLSFNRAKFLNPTVSNPALNSSDKVELPNRKKIMARLLWENVLCFYTFNYKNVTLSFNIKITIFVFSISCIIFWKHEQCENEIVVL